MRAHVEHSHAWTFFDEILRCPATGQPLRHQPSELVSDDGSRIYPIIDGIPWLLSLGNPLFSTPERTATPVGHVRRLQEQFARLASLGPSASFNPGAEARYSRFRDLLVAAAGREERPARVLIIGGGILGHGTESLLNGDVDAVETDVYAGPRTQVVCDAHHLPFADRVFDGVVAQAVLEHVLDPVAVVAEARRVLRPGGYIYAETPFMQQVHEGAFDFTRYTHVGHRRLLSYFDEIDSGATAGPATALVWSLRYFSMAFAGRVRPARRLIDRIVTFVTFWLKYLDLALVHSPGALDAASGLYFIGRLRAAPISDPTVVESYRGAMRRAPLRHRS